MNTIIAVVWLAVLVAVIVGLVWLTAVDKRARRERNDIIHVSGHWTNCDGPVYLILEPDTPNEEKLICETIDEDGTMRVIGKW